MYDALMYGIHCGLHALKYASSNAVVNDILKSLYDTREHKSQTMIQAGKSSRVTDVVKHTRQAGLKADGSYIQAFSTGDTFGSHRNCHSIRK